MACFVERIRVEQSPAQPLIDYSLFVIIALIGWKRVLDSAATTTLLSYAHLAAEFVASVYVDKHTTEIKKTNIQNVLADERLSGQGRQSQIVKAKREDPFHGQC